MSTFWSLEPWFDTIDGQGVGVSLSTDEQQVRVDINRGDGQAYLTKDEATTLIDLLTRARDGLD